MHNRRLLDISEWAFFGAVALGCMMTLRLATYQFAVPYQLNYEEGNVLNAAVRIAHGESPYPTVQPLVYVFNSYGPVVYYLIEPLVEHFGVNFTYPRVLVCSAGLLIAALMALMLRHETRSWRLGLSFGLLYLTMPVVQDWVYLLRVDLVGVFLALAGLAICGVYPRRWYLAAPLFVGAVYCKYTLVAAPAACSLHFGLSKAWGRALRLAASVAALSLAAFAVVQRETQGWFAFHMFRSHPDPYSLSQWASMILPLLAVHAVLVVFAVALIVEKVGQRAVSLQVIYLALATLMTVTAGKIGSDTNHLLEWLAALCLAAGLGYQRLRQRVRLGWMLALAPLALVLLVLSKLPFDLDVEPERDGCPQAYTYVRETPGAHFLSENVGAIVLAGKPVTFSNPFTYAFLVKDSKLSDVELSERVGSRSFDAILLGEELKWLKEQAADPESPDTIWYASFVDALEKNYHLAREFACTGARFAYEPNPGSAPGPGPALLKGSPDELPAGKGAGKLVPSRP